MSAAQPYLHKVRKSQLLEFAELTDLTGYNESNKPDLVEALDKHLVANRSIFAGEPRLADYYRRLAQPARFATPAKRATRVEVNSTPSEEIALSKSSRRRQPVRPEVKKEKDEDEEGEETKSKQEATTDDSDAASSVRDPAPVTQTPRQTQTLAAVELPPSPAVITEAIDRQTTEWTQRVEDTWVASGVKERSHALRSLLSSVKSVETLVLILEGSSVAKDLWPLRYLTTIPAIEEIHTPEFPLRVPDLFVLLDGSFWAPFSLWLLTSLFLPLVVAYFFNISLHIAQQQQSGAPTRRGAAASRTAQSTTFDPLSFNIAKALITYLVYAKHFTFWDLYSSFSVEKVNTSVPGQWAGMLTGTAIGLIGTLYEAILRK